MKRISILASLMLIVVGVSAQDQTVTDGLACSGAELDDILAAIVSTNSPLGNLAANLSTNLQVSLPPCKSLLPQKTGNTTLEAFNARKAGLRLTVRIETRILTRLIVRADVNHFDPNRGYANVGAQWKRLEFELKDGHWRLSKDLGGAIK